MTRVLACIDGSVYSASVADHAAWAATRLGADIEFLQVLGRREATSDDRSGRIVAGARKQLLDQLATLDRERATLLRERARLDLDAAREAALKAGAGEVTTLLRNGDMMETLIEREAEADLVVVGKRGEAADFATLHLGSNLERIVRTSERPVLIAARAFRPIAKVMLAFDGRTKALKAVDAISRSSAFAGLAFELVTIGEPSAAASAALDAAAAQLTAGGLAVTTRIEPGRPETAIPAIVEKGGVDLLVMGAYGHSRLRALMLGSATSEMIRACRIPLLVYR